MRAQLLLAATFALALSGCFGYPPGVARDGSRVGAMLSLTDAASDGPCYLDFTLGDPGIPPALRDAADGAQAGDKATLELTGPADLVCHHVVQRDLVIGRLPLVQSAPRRDFEAALGAAHVGQNFQLSSGTAATVVALNATSVDYRIQVPAESRRNYPALGLDLVETVEGNDVVSRVAANVTGAVFRGPITQLIEQPGNWTTAGQAGGKLVIANADGEAVHLAANTTLHVTFTVLSVRAPPAVPGVGEGGNYGVRRESELPHSH